MNGLRLATIGMLITLPLIDMGPWAIGAVHSDNGKAIVYHILEYISPRRHGGLEVELGEPVVARLEVWDHGVDQGVPGAGVSGLDGPAGVREVSDGVAVGLDALAEKFAGLGGLGCVVW
ncbi:hypothetical protein KSP40_PGU002688 [Platanthera guangdongensis]|uniref:Uncharacterized protein n=1 Tax=Platanthera guangdongensis TaxID=2320717 RepID=A0ABR2LV08_9ASPA